MKKLLILLSAITIAGNGISGIVGNAPTPEKNEINYSQTNNLENLNRVKRRYKIAASPYQKEESIKNSDISDINYQQTNSTEILKRNKRSNENQLEVWYEFLAHNTLKAKISHETWKTISFKHSILNNQEFKNWLYLYLNEFPKLNKSDAGDWDEMNRTDIETIRNIIADKFNEINNVFINKNNDNLGLLIVTNRASYWKQDNYYGVHVN